MNALTISARSKLPPIMQSFLDNANPEWYGRGRGRKDVTVREAIDDAARRIDTELADQPEVRADIHYSFGQVYATHGDGELFLRHMRQSLELYRQALGEQHPKVARAMYYLSMAMKGNGSDLEEVKTLLRVGIAMMRQTEPDNVNLPYMLQELANWIMLGEQHDRNETRLAEAESLLLEARTLFIRHYGENQGQTVSADNSLATLTFTRGDLARAESMREELLGRFRQAEEGGYSHIWTYFSLAEVKLARGKVTEAEALFEEALGLGRKQWGVNDFQFKRLVKEIGQARTASPR